MGTLSQKMPYRILQANPRGVGNGVGKMPKTAQKENGLQTCDL